MENSEPIKYSYSKEEMIKLARDFCVNVYGSPSEAEDKDKWMERFGFLVSFVTDQFPK